MVAAKRLLDAENHTKAGFLMKMNIKRISEVTGFSPATVSNALNNKRGVSRETAERIQAVAREYGYVPEMKIDNIKLVVYKRVGVVVSDTPFFSALIAGVESESRSAGYETTICNLDRGDPHFEEKRSQLLNDPNCAILLLATEMEEEDIRPFENALAPIVVLDSWFDEMTFNSVLISNTDSVCNAVKRLIRGGHRAIGYLRGSIRIKNFYYREMGWMRALNGAGIPVHEQRIFSLTPTMEGAFADMCARLRENPTLPTAFFADNDIIALGAMRALQERGYRIPEDISIIGFDDLPFGAISMPPLTTIRVHKEEMGRTAVRRLIEMMKNDTGVKTKIQVCNTFVERGSIRDRAE